MQSGHVSGADFGASRGILRDSLGVLTNLDQLLRSIRVSPKAIASVLPDVHVACRPMKQALADLLDVLSRFEAATVACEKLATFFEPRMNELETALGQALGNTLAAKHRLHLEKVVGPITLELDAVRQLVDLLCESVTGPVVRVLLTEVIEEAFKSPEPTPGAAVVHVEVALSAPDLDLVVNPRVSTAFLAHATSLVAYGSPADIGDLRSEPRDVSIRIDAGDDYFMEISRRVSRGTGRPMSARQLIAPTEVCLRASAELVRSKFAYSEGSSLTVAWAR